MLERLRNYLKNTPFHVLKAEWEKITKPNSKGPNAYEFIYEMGRFYNEPLAAPEEQLAVTTNEKTLEPFGGFLYA